MENLSLNYPCYPFLSGALIPPPIIYIHLPIPASEHKNYMECVLLVSPLLQNRAKPENQPCYMTTTDRTLGKVTSGSDWSKHQSIFNLTSSLRGQLKCFMTL